MRYSPPRVRPPSDHPSSIEKLYLAQRDDEQIDLYIGEHIHPSKQEGLRAEIIEARATGVAFNQACLHHPQLMTSALVGSGLATIGTGLRPVRRRMRRTKHLA